MGIPGTWMTEQELVIDLPVDGPAVRNPQLVEGKLCSTLIGGKKKLQVNQVVPGLSRIQLMNPYPNSTVRDWYATLGMTMRVCLRNASDKLNFQISNPQIRLFCCLETHQSPSLVQNLRKWEVPSSFVGEQCLSWGGNDLSVEDSTHEPMVF